MPTLHAHAASISQFTSFILFMARCHHSFASKVSVYSNGIQIYCLSKWQGISILGNGIGKNGYGCAKCYIFLFWCHVIYFIQCKCGAIVSTVICGYRHPVHLLTYRYGMYRPVERPVDSRSLMPIALVFWTDFC